MPIRGTNLVDGRGGGFAYYFRCANTFRNGPSHALSTFELVALPAARNQGNATAARILLTTPASIPLARWNTEHLVNYVLRSG